MGGLEESKSFKLRLTTSRNLLPIYVCRGLVVSEGPDDPLADQFRTVEHQVPGLVLQVEVVGGVRVRSPLQTLSLGSSPLIPLG